MKDIVDFSVIVPMYNEEENVVNTASQICNALDGFGGTWEVVIVNDGSTDRTLEIAQGLSSQDPRVRVVSHPRNFGRGKGLRTGFDHTRGEIIATIDADLSYGPEHLLDLLRALRDDLSLDFVIGSPYTEGGSTEGVPPHRLLISKWGNKIIGLALNAHVDTATGILRAYRRRVLAALELESDGKEIHLEILSKAIALGFRFREVPAVLKGREAGTSKFRFWNTVTSHLIFSFTERPMIVFGVLGLVLLLLGLAGGVYVTVLRFGGMLNPERPLMTLVVLLILGGIQLLAFGFIAIQLGTLRKEVYKVQWENRLLLQWLAEGDEEKR
jgi:glycosyltransferase involved in cell wall biosynthesis